MSPSSLPVITLVASTGGIPALGIVLRALPADLPCPVVVLQHLDPDRPSVLAEILQRSTDLKVVVAEDGAPLEPGVVLVAPAGVHTLITHERRISLVHSGAYPPSRPSADLLLTSLALAAGPGAIAVVMSGGGQDGATGATAVHKHGGAVLVTDEATSRVFSMPSATIARDAIDPTVVPVEGVAGALLRLVMA